MTPIKSHPPRSPNHRSHPPPKGAFFSNQQNFKDDENLSLEEVTNLLLELTQQKVDTENRNAEISQRAEQLMGSCSIFESLFSPKLDEFNNAVIRYNDTKDAFYNLVQNEELPEKSINKQLETLHEKVTETQRKHVQCLETLVKFYENCVNNLTHVKVENAEMLELRIKNLDEIKKEKEKPPTPPPPPPPAPVPVIRENMAVALFDYKGGHRQAGTELIFSRGDEIQLEGAEESGWQKGHLLSEPNFDGWFPVSYVKKIE